MPGSYTGRIGFFACLLCVLLACEGRAPSGVVFHEQQNPARLSAWSLFHLKGDRLVLAENAIPYFLASELFSDYAQKFRTLSLPGDKVARLRPDGSIDFPVGTVISKTFYYPLAGSKTDTGRLRFMKAPPADWGKIKHLPALGQIRLVETRLLIRRAAGWVGLPYVWSEDQQDAMLERTGAVFAATLVAQDGETDFSYLVPNQNQCAGCHTLNHASKALEPIGPRYRHLKGEQNFFAGRQLEVWQAAGWLARDEMLKANASPESESANWRDANVNLNDRARAYLDVNCGHCHSPVGPADTSGLFLSADTSKAVRLGVCKPPVAAGRGTGGRRFSIVPGQSEASILVYRMASRDPGAMMPELGRSLVHKEGVALMSAWIQQMQGECEGAPSGAGQRKSRRLL